MSKLKYVLSSVSGFFHSILKEVYLALRRANDFASASRPKSWLFHLISYFLLSCAVITVKISPWFVVGAALAQEYEQFLHHFTLRNGCDFVMDLLADATALFLAINFMGIL